MYSKEVIILFLFSCILQSYNAINAPRLPAKLYSLNDNDILNEWQSFKNRHNRFYTSKISEQTRLSIFKDNLVKINQQNQKFNNGFSQYTFGINRFSDMTSDEFMAYVNQGLKIKNMFELMANISVEYKPSVSKVSLPTSVDWRTQGYVNDILDQGNCGSCWAFSSVSALESQYFKTNGALLKFSEQQLVDCTYKGTDGCQGGFMTDAFSYIKQKGIELSSSYDYKSGVTGRWSGSCKYSALSVAAQISGFITVTNGIASESLLTDAIANQGPISVALCVTNAFQLYSSGVYTDNTCSQINLNHAVTLVGYDTLNGEDYYILRNSWGASWGQNGYMFFRRNNNNQCGISSYASYPIVQSSGSTTTSDPSSITTTPNPISTTTSDPSSITTTPNPLSTTTNSKPKACSKGAGWYANPGCQTGYYCQIQIKNYQCLFGYLFDVNTNTCKPPALVTCNPLRGTCANGSGYYVYPGCQMLYFCTQNIYNYSCKPGYLLDARTGKCKSTAIFTCPI